MRFQLKRLNSTSIKCFILVTYPLDTIRARLAFQVTGEHKYTGIVHVATSMLKEEGGVRALYRGFLPTLMVSDYNFKINFVIRK